MQNGTQKDAFYFPHDFNARRDEKCWALIKDMGFEAYGRYWAIVECLGERSNHKIEKGPRYLEMLADELKMDITLAESFLRKLIDTYKLFTEDETYIWSESFLRRMSIREERRRQKVEAGRRGGQKTAQKKQASLKQRSSSAKAPLKQRSSGAQARKGKKGKESKEIKESKEQSFLFLNDVDFKKAFSDFLEMRIKNRVPATEAAKKIILEKLHKYNLKTAIAMLKRATERSWRTVWPLKDLDSMGTDYREEQERRDREKLEKRKDEAAGPDPETRKKMDVLLGKTSVVLAAPGAENTRG
jgi:hypothetical protein